MAPAPDTVDAPNPHAGERLFIDYAGQTVGVTDGTTGEIRAAQVFGAVLGASYYTYLEATWSQQLLYLIETLLYRVERGHMKVAESKLQVYQGRLMSPNEVRSAIYQRGGIVPHKYQQSWYVCGDVTDEFFRRVARDERPMFGIDIFRVNANTSFAVFSLQIREQQARFLLPFASEKSVRLAEQVNRTGIFLSLGRAGTEDALLLEFIDTGNQFGQLRDVAKRCSRLPCDLDINELKLASYSMTHASSIPSRAAADVVSDVCLNVILDD